MKNNLKKIAVILVINCLFFNAINGQIKTNKELPFNYENEQEIIYKVYKGDAVNITIDSAYIFNDLRFKDVKKLLAYRDFMRSKDPMAKAFETVWDNHSKSLDSLEKYVNLLKINAEQTEKTGKDLALNTIRIAQAADIKLDTVSNQLTSAQNQLKTANTYLDDAVKLIKQDIRWRWLKNAALVAIGAILGYFIAK